MPILTDIELHDAVLICVEFDFPKAEARLVVNYYKTEDAKSRVGATIRFAGVTSTSQVVDGHRLEINAAAGNINYWSPTEGGTTYIYLVDGVISIGAASIEFTDLEG